MNKGLMCEQDITTQMTGMHENIPESTEKAGHPRERKSDGKFACMGLKC